MFNYLLYRLGQFVALILPLKMAYGFAVFVSDIHYLFANIDKAAVEDNLKAIFPEKDIRSIHYIRKRMFRNFAKYLVDFFRFSLLDAEYIRKNIKIENKAFLDEALAKGCGVITLTAHIGNWELGGVVIALLGYPFSAVALPHKDKKVNDFFNYQRQSKGIKVIPLGRAVRQCMGILRKNEVLALVGDRDFTEKGILIDFFGKPAIFPEGAAAFAVKAKAVIIPGFMVRNSDDTFTLRFEKPLKNIESDNKKTEIKDLILHYKPIFEDYIRRYPDQWYMFRRFWVS
jgi:lauroyl/myristoyl acyltransferase